MILKGKNYQDELSVIMFAQNLIFRIDNITVIIPMSPPLKSVIMFLLLNIEERSDLKKWLLKKNPKKLIVFRLFSSYRVFFGIQIVHHTL